MLDRSDLAGDRALVIRQLFRQIGELLSDDRAEAADNGDGEQHDQRDRGHARHAPAAQRSDERRENEAQKNCDRDRDEDGAPDIKRGDDQRERDQHRDLAEKLGLVHRGGDAGRRGF